MDRPDRDRVPADAEGASFNRAPVKATDREGDAARTEGNFNCVAYHRPLSILRRRLSSSIMTAIGTFETWRSTLTMSVSKGRPEVVGRRSPRRSHAQHFLQQVALLWLATCQTFSLRVADIVSVGCR